MTVCPFAVWRPISANYGPALHLGNIHGFVPHSQVGYGSLFDTFNNPARKASTHFQIMQDGTLFQYVDTDVQAWAEGNGNPYFWSSEFEGMSANDGPDEMTGDPFTPGQLDTGGRLIAWLHGLAEFPIVAVTDLPQPDGIAAYGLVPHRSMMQTACPGRLRLSQYPELVASTLRYLDPPVPPIPILEKTEMVTDVLAMYSYVKQAADHAGVSFWLGVYEAHGSQVCWDQFMGAVAASGHPVP